MTFRQTVYKRATKKTDWTSKTLRWETKLECVVSTDDEVLYFDVIRYGETKIESINRAYEEYADEAVRLALKVANNEKIRESA